MALCRRKYIQKKRWTANFKCSNAIGFNPKRVEYSKRIKYNNDEELYLSRTFRVRIRNRLFAENLMNYGFPVGKKASKIRFPLLKSKDFDLAFLLGFFDGDGYISHSKFGKVKEIKIFSKSRLFLSDVKSRFELEYKIGQNKGRKKDGTTTYLNTLNLGFSLYKKQLPIMKKVCQGSVLIFINLKLRGN